MPAKRLSMRKIKDVLRLCWGQGVSKRQVARSCGISRPTVRAYLRRAEAAGLCWPLPAELDDGALERVLFPLSPAAPETARGAPDWSEVHRELKRPGVTLLLLWQEYRQAHPHGYQYTWFCQQYRAWTGKLDLVMRQTHRAGEKLFVDYAGMRARVIDPETGEVREAEVFVAVLGASNYTYAEATWTQGLQDWVGAHVRCFTYLGGVPEVVVPDNLRAGVAKAHRYEPDINPTYQDLATHYGVAIIPARVRRPRDKAKAEVGVQVVERWILAALRHRQCFSLAELNRAIRELLETLNNRPFRKLPGNRRALFEQLDKPALRPLPVEPYEYAEWKQARVHIDYHVEVQGHYYSVPHALIKKTGGRAHHRQHHRMLPPRPAHRQPPALAPESPAHHHHRPHARVTPPGRRVVPGAPGTLGDEHRHGHGATGPPQADGPQTPAAGLPQLLRHPAPGKHLRQ